MKGKGKVLSALLAAALFVGAAIPALAAGENGKAGQGFTVNAAAEPTGAPLPTVSTYTVGKGITVTPGADTNDYRFNKWTPADTGTVDYLFVLSVTYKAGESVSVTAVYDVKVTVTNPANGAITVEPALPEDGFVDINTAYTFTLTPNANYMLDGWSGVTGEGNTVTAKFTAPANVTATVKAKPATVRSVKVAVSDTKAGKVTTDGTTTVSSFDLDTDQTKKLVAVPNADYEFVNWTIGSKVLATTAEYTVKYTDVADKDTITANFKAKATAPGGDEEVADNVANAIGKLDSEQIDKMEPAKAAEKLEEALEGVTAGNAADVADKLAKTLKDDELANLDALMNQANPIKIDGKDVSLEIEEIEALKDEEPVGEIKFAGLSLLAIKERAQVKMTPKQKPASHKFINLSSAKMAIDLTLTVDGKVFTDDLPKGVKIDIVVPEKVANSKYIHIYHYKGSNVIIEHRKDKEFVKESIEGGQFKVTFTMNSFSDVVFSDEEVKNPTPTRPTYSGGGGGGMAGFTSYVITATAGPGGSISNPGESRYDAGTYVTYRITPDAGYVIDKVIVDGTKEVALTNGTYTFPLLDQPYTINATFRPVSGSAGEPSAPATAAPNPSTGDSWFAHLFF